VEAFKFFIRITPVLSAWLLNISFICYCPKPATVTVAFYHCAGNHLLRLDSGIYQNELGEEFKVTKLKYYIGNIVLKNSAGNDFALAEHFLISEEEPLSKLITLEGVPAGNYTRIEFIIGVDSIHNCSGAQAGSLDPVNAMFWTWNSGYIFLKLEGRSPNSPLPGHIFEYHIGGYKQPNNCLRKVSLEVHLNVSSKKNETVRIKTDVLEILKKPASIAFKKLPSVTDAGNAGTIADNYRDMFSVMKKEDGFRN
jgi:hypothetical protein